MPFELISASESDLQQVDDLKRALLREFQALVDDCTADPSNPLSPGTTRTRRLEALSMQLSAYLRLKLAALQLDGEECHLTLRLDHGEPLDFHLTF